MDVWLAVLGVVVLLADVGIIFAVRRRVPPDRMSLCTLPVFIVGFVLIVLGVT